MPRRLALLGSAALLLGVAAAPGLGAWESPRRASSGPLDAHSPAVAANARGDAAAAWVRGTGRDAMIVVSLRPAGGGWSRQAAISRRGRKAIDPQVAVDGQGRVVVVWRQVVRTRLVRARGGLRRQAVYVAHARERDVAEGRWGRITTLSSDRHKVGPPQLAVDEAGGAVVAWHWGTGTRPSDRGFVGRVQLVERRSDGSWTAPARVSRSPRCLQVRRPRVAAGAKGGAVVWWQCDLPRGRSTALAVGRPPGGGFGDEVELPFRSRGDLAADLAVAAGGRAVAISAPRGGALRWWRGTVAPVVALSPVPALAKGETADRGAGGPRIAATADGDALSAWTDALGRPRAAPLAADLGAGAARTLDRPGLGATRLRVAIGSGVRRATVAWVADGRVHAATREADGAVEQGIAISGDGVSDADPPALAADGAGAAAVFWTRSVHGRLVVERAVTAGA
ncbi:hypothetical protein [Miltoncostaea marina]|uniref:hypothetical protein n=1 Tax=Miltoncostaea marina TaxID=2843215 RepID=UPI001C3D5CD8|nr:hypothetical protein [Miltoncostaea marina]